MHKGTYEHATVAYVGALICEIKMDLNRDCQQDGTNSNESIPDGEGLDPLYFLKLLVYKCIHTPTVLGNFY
jgi:hypothetical protein